MWISRAQPTNNDVYRENIGSIRSIHIGLSLLSTGYSTAMRENNVATDKHELRLSTYPRC